MTDNRILSLANSFRRKIDRAQHKDLFVDTMLEEFPTQCCGITSRLQERQIENLEQFIQRVRRYTTLTELTPYALRELVKAVYVEAPDKSSGKRKQKVHIEYDLVGYIPVDELIKAEQA